MKKSLVATLTGALVVGATATTFAAANPFSDVPAGHWAYNSVTKLTQDGIIEGYGDGTFRGNRQITRYEMAQMVARALAKTPTTTISTANRAELDKLSAEFRDELDNLGVRIDELERNADKVKWAGKIEYTYGKLKNKTAHTESTGNGGVFRLEPVAEVNDHWTANARFDAGFDAKNDTTNDVKLKRWFAKGDYDKFSVTFGRFGYCPNEGNIVVDTVVSGAQMSFGSKWKFTATGGRVSGAGDGNEASYLMTGGKYNDVNYTDGAFRNDPMDLVGINVQYDQGETGLFGGGSWYYAKNSDFRNTFYSNDGTTDKANIWAANLGYRVAENLTVSGAYAKNSKADREDYGWDALIRLGNYRDYSDQGDWAVWAGYSRFGYNVAIASDQTDDVQTGTKGWHVGAAYAPFKNTGLLVRYADGKYITGGDKFRKVFARAEWFF